MNVTTNDLLALIGKQSVEIELLRTKVKQLEAASEAKQSKPSSCLKRDLASAVKDSIQAMER